MKALRILLLIILCNSLLSGCAQLVPVLVPLAQSRMQPLEFSVPDDDKHTNVEPDRGDDWCAPEDFECSAEHLERTLAEGGILTQFTAVCEIPDSDDDCIGTFTYEIWAFKPKSKVTAHHEGDGEFVVTLFREDSTSEVIFSAVGVYTSETITLETTNVVSMTVQSTGPWEVDFKRVE